MSISAAIDGIISKVQWWQGTTLTNIKEQNKNIFYRSICGKIEIKIHPWNRGRMMIFSKWEEEHKWYNYVSKL